MCAVLERCTAPCVYLVCLLNGQEEHCLCRDRPLRTCMLVGVLALCDPPVHFAAFLQKPTSEGSAGKSSQPSQSRMETPSASSSDLFSAHDFDIHIELPSANKCELHPSQRDKHTVVCSRMGNWLKG